MSKTCKYCGAELKHVKPCPNDEQSMICRDRQEAMKEKQSVI